MKIVKRRSIRRDGLHQPDDIRAERDTLAHYVDREAKTRRLQLMAYGAKSALDWVLDNRNDMTVSRMLSLTECALRLEKRPPMKLVPRFMEIAKGAKREGVSKPGGDS